MLRPLRDSQSAGTHEISSKVKPYARGVDTGFALQIDSCCIPLLAATDADNSVLPLYQERTGVDRFHRF